MPKMLVWKRQLPLNMAIFGIYVRFLGCILYAFTKNMFFNLGSGKNYISSTPIPSMYGILYLPTFNHKDQSDAGKYTSPMDPMGQFQQIPPATNSHGDGGGASVKIRRTSCCRFSISSWQGRTGMAWIFMGILAAPPKATPPKK